MKYSRALQVEYENPPNPDGEGAYTIFSVIQPLQTNGKPHSDVSLQLLGILWDGLPDTRLIAMAEQALIEGVLSPVILLHASKGSLHVVHTNILNGHFLNRFRDAWTQIGLGVWYDEWTTEFLMEMEVHSHLMGGRLVRDYAPGILDKHDLGIQPFTREMFLFYDDWSAENMQSACDSEDYPYQDTRLPDDVDDFCDQFLDLGRHPKENSND